MKIIDVKNLIHDYLITDENGEETSRSRAIDGLDLQIEEGSFVAVLGHNGSGKSTFAKHLNGILLPTEGTVIVSEMDTKQDDLLLRIRRKIGMVFQNPDNQIVSNVVEEDVGFGPENIGIPTEDIWTRVDKSLKAVGMEAYRYKSPNQLSGGQKQRVAIAGVLAMKPKCIVLDEPTAMLDPIGRREVIKTISQLNKEEGITILLITHYMEEVTGADRVVVMDKGHILMDGTPREIFARGQELRAHGLDVPQVTTLADELRSAGMDLAEGIITVDELVEEVARAVKG